MHYSSVNVFKPEERTKQVILFFGNFGVGRRNHFHVCKDKIKSIC